jgi:protein SCO1/2
MNMSRSTWIILLVAVLAAAAGLLLGRKLPVATGDAPTLAHGLAYPAPRPLAPFTLARADGTPFTRDDLDGRWTLLFVGFTHCPDVCPTTLGTFKQLEPLLAKDAPDVPVSLVFVSVDPERDDAAQLASYTSYFSPRIVAATGSKPELDAFTRQLGVLYAKVPLEGTGYTIDHSIQIMLIDPQARLAAIFRPPHDAAAIVADLRTLAEAGR